MQRFAIKGALFSLSLLVAGLTAQAVPQARAQGVEGVLDRSFNGSGYVQLNQNPGNEDNSDLLIQPDGKILTGGNSWVANSGDFLVARWQSNGELDSTFGSNGSTKLDITEGEARLTDDGDRLEAMALQPDGRILLAGRSGVRCRQNDCWITIVRLMPDGQLDSTFGSNGIALIDTNGEIVGGGGVAKDIHVAADGRILVLLEDGLLLLSTNGSLDSSLGTDGVSKLPDVPNRYLKATAFSVDTRRNVWVTGESCASSVIDVDRQCELLVVRFQPDGQVDSQFGTKGIFSADVGDYHDRGKAIAHTREAHTVVGGEACNLSEIGVLSCSSLVMKLLPGGELDRSFGQSGILVIPDTPDRYNSPSYVSDILLLNNEKPAIAVVDGGTSKLVRLTREGQLDATFGSGGVASLPTEEMPDGFPFMPRSIALQSDGKLVVTGEGRLGANDDRNYNAVVARFTSSPTSAPLPRPTVGPTRTFGKNRYETAIRLSEEFFQSGTQELFIATGTSFADALATGPIAGARGAPVLLTQPTGMSEQLIQEIQRLKPKKVYLVGGKNAVGGQVENQVKDLGYPVTRISGTNRFETATALSQDQFASGSSSVFVVSGESYADAVSAGPAAGVLGAPLLLVGRTLLPSATRDELLRLNPDKIYVVGGISAISQEIFETLKEYADDIQRVAGNDRYETSALVSQRFFSADSAKSFLVTGQDFPDALVAGSIASASSSPVLISKRSCLPPSILLELNRVSPNTIHVVGGSSSLSAEIEQYKYCE